MMVTRRDLGSLTPERFLQTMVVMLMVNLKLKGLCNIVQMIGNGAKIVT